jgi:hypothetical protein
MEHAKSILRIKNGLEETICYLVLSLVTWSFKLHVDHAIILYYIFMVIKLWLLDIDTDTDTDIDIDTYRDIDTDIDIDTYRDIDRGIIKCLIN